MSVAYLPNTISNNDSIDGVCRDRNCLADPDAHCKACSRRHVIGTVACATCLHEAATNLDDILDGIARLRSEAFHGANKHGRPNAGQRIPGSTALELTLPYADPEARENVVLSIIEGRIEGDADHGPETPRECLAGWAMRMRDEWGLYGDDAVLGRVNLDDDITVLVDHMMQASQRWVAFPAMAADLHAQATTLARVLGLDDGDVRSSVPCPDCEHWMHVVVGESDTTDSLVCKRFACGASMPLSRGAEHVLAVVTKDTPEVDEAWVYIADAAKVIGRSVQTLHTWVGNGVIEYRVGRGRRKEVPWSDVMREHEARATRDRKKTAPVEQPLAQVIPFPVRRTATAQAKEATA